MRQWLHDHSLTLVIGALWLLLHGLRFVVEKDSYAYDMFTGHADDTFGALIIVLATKYFIERGSTQSK